MLLIRSRRLVLPGLLPLLLATSVAPAAPMTVEEIERLETRILDSRRMIERCEMGIECRYSGPDGKPLLERDLDLHYWLDGHKIRMDVVRWVSSESRTRHVHCWNGDAPGFRFIYTPDKPGGPKVAAGFQQITDKDERSKQPSDPRSLGLIPLALINCYGKPLDTVIGRRSRTNLTGDRTGEAGNEVVTIHYDMNKTTKCLATIRVNPVPVVERVEYITPANKPGDPPTLQNVLESKYEHERPQDRALPSSFVYTVYRSGKITERHQGVLKVISVNSPIDPKEFTLKGFGLPDGTVIMNVPPDRGTLVQTRDGIVPYSPKEHGNSEVPKSNSPGKKWRLWAGVAASASIMVAGCALYIVRRARNRSRERARTAAQAKLQKA